MRICFIYAYGGTFSVKWGRFPASCCNGSPQDLSPVMIPTPNIRNKTTVALRYFQRITAHFPFSPLGNRRQHGRGGGGLREGGGGGGGGVSSVLSCPSAALPAPLINY